jgi:hypothetical protein
VEKELASIPSMVWGRRRRGERELREKMGGSWWVLEIFTMGSSSFMWWRIDHAGVRFFSLCPDVCS